MNNNIVRFQFQGVSFILGETDFGCVLFQETRKNAYEAFWKLIHELLHLAVNDCFDMNGLQFDYEPICKDKDGYFSVDFNDSFEIINTLLITLVSFCQKIEFDDIKMYYTSGEVGQAVLRDRFLLGCSDGKYVITKQGNTTEYSFLELQKLIVDSFEKYGNDDEGLARSIYQTLRIEMI
jgi:hypothetical protein